MKKLILILMFPLLLLCAGCTAFLSDEPESPVISEGANAEYIKISPREARDMITVDVVILDVRTQEEYDAGHVANAVLLPYDEVRERIAALVPDKDKIILVYCRAGVRSKRAALELIELGYTQVFDVGGMTDSIGEIVKEKT